MDTADLPDLIKTADLAAKLGIHVQVLRNKQRRGMLPPCASISTPNQLWWSLPLIDRWIEAGCPMPVPVSGDDNQRGTFV